MSFRFEYFGFFFGLGVDYFRTRSRASSGLAAEPASGHVAYGIFIHRIVIVRCRFYCYFFGHIDGRVSVVECAGRYGPPKIPPGANVADENVFLTNR